MVLTGKEEVETIVNRMPSRPIPNYAFQNNKDLTFLIKPQIGDLRSQRFQMGLPMVISTMMAILT